MWRKRNKIIYGGADVVYSAVDSTQPHQIIASDNAIINKIIINRNRSITAQFFVINFVALSL